MQAIKSSSKEKHWSHAEIEYLQEYAQTKPVNKLANELGRSLSSVKDMLIQFGFRSASPSKGKPRPPKWTVAEKDFIRTNWATMTPEEVAAALGRTPKGVISFKAKLKLDVAQLKTRHQLWLSKEVQFLTDHWEAAPSSELAKQLNRSYESICQKAKALGLPPRQKERSDAALQFYPFRAWTKADDQFIIDSYKTMRVVDIAQQLKRQKDVVIGRAKALGCRRKVHTYLNWSQQEKDDFSYLFKTLPLKELAIKLGKPIANVRLIANRLGLSTDPLVKTSTAPVAHTTDKKGMAWTEEEETYLRANYLLLNSRQLAKQLKRTLFSVQDRMIKMGLRRSQEVIQTLRDSSADDISDVRATAMISHNPEIRQALLELPQVLTLQKANHILKRKIKLASI